MSILGLVHVNVNCSDFDRSLKFYELLGFRKYLDVPSTNTEEVAAAVGMAPYQVKGALLALENAKTPFVIDLLAWQDPNDDEAPYNHLYHLGINRIALATDDLEHAMVRLKSEGVEFKRTISCSRSSVANAIRLMPK
jgi:catechol 2,3-dioxygenase-like lactoylglutathione lyase family enzyme